MGEANILKMTSRFEDDVEDNLVKTFRAPFSGVEQEPLVGMLEAAQAVASLVPSAPAFAEESLKRAAVRETLDDGLSVDEAASIFFYTANECPAFSKMNAALRNEDSNGLRPFFPYLRLLIEALSKLPRHTGSLNRGINFQSNLELVHKLKAQFEGIRERNENLTWWSFTSTTTNMGMLHRPAYLGSTGHRILFSMSNVSVAFNITKYSFFPGEEEVILAPGHRFTVEGVLELPGPDAGSNLVLVNLSEATDFISLVPDTPPLVISTSEWPNCYLTVASTKRGELQGVTVNDVSELSDASKFQLKRRRNGTYLITTAAWPGYYIYQGNDGIVSSWKGDPGPQGYWTITYEADGTRRLTTECWPNRYAYMSKTNTGDVKTWDNEDPGPQGHFLFSRQPTVIKPNQFASIVPGDEPMLLYSASAPTWGLKMDSGSEGFLVVYDTEAEDAGRKAQLSFSPAEKLKGTYQMATKQWPSWFLYVNSEDNRPRAVCDDPGAAGYWRISPADGGATKLVTLSVAGFPDQVLCLDDGLVVLREAAEDDINSHWMMGQVE
eukprot:c52336_g1_i1.p1 GENE.c52336_g1_i1~~c52336_g1_i1.p1  ORF type:complete len:551 (+),score=82.19 c52336_g1_i1:1-1653(+)